MVFSKNNKRDQIPLHTFSTRNGTAKLYRLVNETTGKQPVLFIHGFNSTEKIWFNHITKHKEYEGFAERAFRDGYDVWVLGLSKSKMANLIELAEDDLLTTLMFIHATTKRKTKIIAHSMSGVLCRYLSHPIFLENANSEKIILESMVSEVITLATPHQGFTIKHKSKNRIFFFMEYFEKWASKKKKFPLYSGFFQFLSQSDLFVTLNTDPYLHPGIKWINAVAIHDFFIHKSSILPLDQFDGLEQKFFNVNHFKLPFYEFILKVTNKINVKTDKIDFFTSLPIYWSNEVYDWIFSYN